MRQTKDSLQQAANQYSLANPTREGYNLRERDREEFLRLASDFEQSSSIVDQKIKKMEKRLKVFKKIYKDFYEKKSEFVKKKIEYNECMNKQEQP